MFNKESKVLVIAPHLDDAELGCGGLMKKLTSKGIEVHVIHLTHFRNSQGKFNMSTGKYEEYSGSVREDENSKAMNILGVTSNRILNIDTDKTNQPGLNKFHHYLDVTPHAKLLSDIEEVIKEINPTDIFVTAPSADQDHIQLAKVIRSSIRPQFFNGSLYEYEVGLETDWQPNVLIRLTEEEANSKVEAIECYETQSSGSDLYPFNGKSAMVRLKYRGIQCGSNYAEAFKLVKKVVVL